jgi:hypothetical protein
MYRHNGEITTLPLTKEDDNEVSRLKKEIERISANLIALRSEKSVLLGNINKLESNVVMPDEILELEDYTDKIQAYFQSHGFAFVNDDNLRLLNTKRGLLRNWSFEYASSYSTNRTIYNDVENGLLNAMYTDFDDNIKVCENIHDASYALKHVADYMSSHVITMNVDAMIVQLNIRKKCRRYNGKDIHLKFICDIHNKPKSTKDVCQHTDRYIFSIYRHPNSNKLYNSKTNMVLDLSDLRDFKLYFYPKYTDDMKNAFYKELTSEIYKQNLKGV